MVSERMESRRRVIFLFVDGVGLGPDDPAVNPLARFTSIIRTAERPWLIQLSWAQSSD